MMKSNAEIERKYEVDEHTALPRLADLTETGIAGLEVGSVVTDDGFRLEAEYVDTAAMDLARHRIALRRRVGGADEGWHLKLPAKEGRTELHWPLDAGGADAAAVPSEVLEPVRAIVRDRDLSVIARLSTRRTTTRVMGVDGAGLVEIADDVVSATDVGSGELRLWREWEAELLEGAPDTASGRTALLDAVEELLTGAGARPAASSSKLASALGRTGLESGTGGPHPLTRSSASSEVLIAALRGLVDDIVRIDPLVRRDQHDSVHQLRTRVRRVRSLLSSYRDVFDRVATGELQAELRHLGEVLGVARDAEVMRERSATLLDDHEEVPGSIRQRVVGGWDERYSAAHDEVVAELSSARYFRLLDRLDGLIDTPPLGVLAFEPAATVVPRVLQHDLKRVRKRAEKADAATAEPDRTESLHDTRKAAKRLRYAAEAVSAGDAAVFGGRVRRLGAAAERVHDLLGEHRDSVLLQQHLRASAPNSVRAFDFGVLHEFERHSAAMCLAEYPGALDDLARAGRRLEK